MRIIEYCTLAVARAVVRTEKPINASNGTGYPTCTDDHIYMGGDRNISSICNDGASKDQRSKKVQDKVDKLPSRLVATVHSYKGISNSLTPYT